MTRLRHEGLRLGRPTLGPMTETKQPIETMTVQAFRGADGTSDWPVIADCATTFFATDSLATSARLIQAIGAIEGVDGHRPRIDIRPGGVTVGLITATDDYMGLSRRDLELARAISAAAARLGLAADGTDVQSVQPIVIGAVDIPLVMPFWKALLGYVQRPDSPEEDIVDPRDRGPGIWFEKVDDLNAMRPRMHVAVWVPPAQAEKRVAAAVAAGGTVIFDENAPSWWTLADPEGNEADVATTTGRD
jgi:4a-hydroxytetrahydrobiopterin dehydratase